nr:hypothetical protein [Tanacetum cinerariifolium]
SSYLVKAYKIYLCCCKDRMLLFHDPAVFGVPADLFCWSLYSYWFWLLLVLVAAGLKLLGAVDELYQKEESDTFSLFLWGDLHVLFQSLDDADALDFGRNQDSWRIRSWRLYPRAQVYVLETVDGRIIHMFVDVSYPLTVATLEHMLKHGLEVPKLLVGGDLTMVEQLISFIKAALLNAKSAV